MSDGTNHDKLAEAGLISGELHEHHVAAINSLSAEEGEQLVALMKKAQSATPDESKEDTPNIF